MTDWRGWKITDEQAEAIRNGDITARNSFYFDNLERIRKMAFNYVQRKPRLYGFASDMIQGVYVDLLFFRENLYSSVVSDGLSLSRFVYASFRACPFGGLLFLSENDPKLLSGGGYKIYVPSNCLSLDSPFGKGDNRHQDDGNARTLGEVIPAREAPDSTDLTEEDLKRIVSDMLSPRENEYFGHFIEGYGNAEISRRMGYGSECNNGCRVKGKLRKNAPLILSRLSALGVDTTYYEGKTAYDPKTERTYKLTPEQRERARESMRRQRALKKAGK